MNNHHFMPAMPSTGTPGSPGPVSSGRGPGRRRRGFLGRSVHLLSCFLWWLLPAVPVVAQEALQNMQAGNTYAQARSQAMNSQQPRDYTLKYGDFQMLVQPSLGVDWNDNIRTSNTNAESDYIVKPAVGVNVSYPFSQRNLLMVDLSVGYQWYLQHSSLSSFDLNSSTGTGLSLDLGIKDVTLNFHDWVRYSQDASQSPNVANTGTYGTFNNTAGLSATWDLNQVTLSAGYDHLNELSTSGQYNNINHASDMLFARAGLQVHPQVTLGLESTATFTRYDKSGTSNNALNDNNAYTVGPYVTFESDQYLSLTARGGISTYQFQQTSASLQTADQNSWYAGVTLAHQPRESINYSIDAGRELSLGTQSDLTQDWYVRPRITWNFIRDWSFNTYFSYQHGKQGTGNVFGNFSETYDWYSAGAALRHALTSRISVALNYRLTIRSSSIDNNGYTQNLVGLQLTYHPQ
jgi:hypothetical protein